jgi:hypothetical protein
LVLWLSACEMDSLIRWSLLNRWFIVMVSCTRDTTALQETLSMIRPDARL